MKHFLVFVVAVCLIGCSSSGDGDVVITPDDFAGTWNIQLQGVVTQSCSGDLSGTTLTFCNNYDGITTQSGSSVTGVFNAPCFPASGSFVGTVSGSVLTGVTNVQIGLETTHTEITATVSGSAITVNFTRITIDGFTGSCSISGTWIGTII